MKATARSLFLSISSLALAASPALGQAADGSCVESAAPVLAAVSTAVSGAAALSSAPSPARFATAWTSYFAAAVRSASGTDGRLSAKEAERLAETSMFGDNAVNWLEAKQQQSVDVDKLIAGGWNYAFATAQKAAGDDGRVSLADAATKLPVDLQADYLFLRGKESASAGADSVAVMSALANSTTGLYLMSESDAWVVPIEAASSRTGEITPEEVQAVFGAMHDTVMTGTTVWRFADPAYARIASRFGEMREASSWLERRSTTDDPNDPPSVENAQKWAATSDVLKGLNNLTVVRFNESSNPDVAITSSTFIVGRSSDGKLVGVLTAAVET